MRRAGAFTLAAGLGLMGLSAIAPTAAVAVAPSAVANAPFTVPAGVTVTTDNGSCNGVITANADDTAKTLVDFADGNLNEPLYKISYPQGTAPNGEWTIEDCVLTGPAGTALKDMRVVNHVDMTGVNNSADFNLQYSVDLSALNPAPKLGDQVCNVAKTTGTPSTKQQSVRKSNPACFVVGGDQRVVKTDAHTEQPVTATPAANWNVTCFYPEGAPANEPVLVNATTVPNDEETAITGANTLAFNGPSGAQCTVVETQAPSGYEMPTAGECGDNVAPPACDTVSVEIGVGEAQDVISYADTPSPVVQPTTRTLAVTNQASGGTGSFDFTVDCPGDSHDGSFPGITANGPVGSVTAIPDGAVCTVTEADPGTGWSTTANSAAGRTVQLTMDADKSADFVNTFTAPIQTPVTRTLTVKNAVNGGNGSFTFHVDCADGAEHDGTFTSDKPGVAGTVAGIPDGTQCTVGQDDAGSGWTTTVNSGTVTSAHVVRAAAAAAGQSVQVVMSADRTVSFANTAVVPTTTGTTTTTQPTTTTTQPQANVLAETVERPATAAAPAATAAAAAPAATPAAAPQVQAQQLARTGRQFGMTMRLALALIGLGLVALVASRRRPEVADQ